MFIPPGSDIVVVAPATANIIGKAANGIADEILSTVLGGIDLSRYDFDGPLPEEVLGDFER